MQTITTFDNTAEGWDRSLYAFLAEKERRSGSRRTVVGYSRMLQHFFGIVGRRMRRCGRPGRTTAPPTGSLEGWSRSRLWTDCPLHTMRGKQGRGPSRCPSREHPPH
jgi:hypothetical protein